VRRKVRSITICRVQPLPLLGPFQERLDTLLTENEARHRRDRLRMTRIHDLLQREGFKGSYDAVRRYARRWAEARRKDAGDGAPAFIPLCSPSAPMAQIWGSDLRRVGASSQ